MSNSLLRIVCNLCFLYSSIVFAQDKGCDFRISGLVRGTVNNAVLANVDVLLQPGNIKATTDERGYYSFSSVCPGVYTLSAKSAQYVESTRNVNLKSNNLVVNFDLGDVIQLEDVHVSGHRQVYPHATSTVRTLNKKMLDENAGDNLALLLNKIAGVTTLSTGATIVKPVINGMSGQRILILNNGVRLEGQQWGSEHAPEIDPLTAGSLTVIKGAEGVRYGADAIGGVILVEPLPIALDKPVTGQFNVIGATNNRMQLYAGRLEGYVPKVKALGWRLQGSYKRAGDYHTAAYNVENTGLKELNFSGEVTYQPKKSPVFSLYYSHYGTTIGIYTGAHVGTIDDIYARIALGRPALETQFSYDIANPKQEITHDMMKFKMHHDLKNGAFLDFQYAFQQNHRKEYDIRVFSAPTTPASDLKLTSQTFDLNYTQQKNEHWRHNFGVNGMIQVNNNTPGTGTTPFIPNYDSFNMGVYAVERYVYNSTELEFGLRFDHKSFSAAGYRYDLDNASDSNTIEHVRYGGDRTFNNLSGNFGYVRHFTPFLDFRSNIGLAWRAPSANELYSNGVHHGIARYEIGDPSLSGEQSYKWVNSLNFERQGWIVNVDAYAQYINNYIYANPSPENVRQTIRGTFPVFEYQQKRAFFWGIDLNASYQISSSLNYAINASLIRAKDVQDHTYLPYIPSDRFSQTIRWDQQIAEHSFFKGTYLSFTHRFVDEQHRYTAGTDYAPPPPAYHLFDAAAGIERPWNHQKIAFSITMQNITNNLYRDYMDSFRYYVHGMGRNVTFRIAYNF